MDLIKPIFVAIGQEQAHEDLNNLVKNKPITAVVATVAMGIIAYNLFFLFSPYGPVTGVVLICASCFLSCGIVSNFNEVRSAVNDKVSALWAEITWDKVVSVNILSGIIDKVKGTLFSSYISNPSSRPPRDSAT